MHICNHRSRHTWFAPESFLMPLCSQTLLTPNPGNHWPHLHHQKSDVSSPECPMDEITHVVFPVWFLFSAIMFWGFIPCISRLFPLLLRTNPLCHNFFTYLLGFPGSSLDKESICNAGDPGSIPGSGRCTGEGIGYPLQYSWASLLAQLVKNPPAMQETWVWSVGSWGTFVSSFFAFINKAALCVPVFQ